MTSTTAILFDLDGTVTDPFIGITRSMRHAIEHLGFESPPPEVLSRWIGPPLRLTFRTVLATEDEDLIERAVAAYRERYFDIGYLENLLYPGIDEALDSISGDDRRLFIVTSKVEQLARMIIDHFRLDRHFAGIYGTEPGGRLDDKADLMREMLRLENVDVENAVMIGDTRFDMIAARSCGVRGIGVTYGYGTRDELVEHGASVVCDAPMELAAAIERVRSVA